jgi:uncharacterized protein
VKLAFLDTGAIYAFTVQRDADHATIRAVYSDETRSFVTHELILVEVFSLLTKRLHKEAAIRVVDALRHSPRVEIAPITPALLEAGWDRCRRFADKNWDWIDCCSFELMEQRGLRDALALDRHFAQAGFTLLA